jgi:hypothetical protein
MRICSVEGCEKIHNSRGYCATHYKQKWHNMEIPGVKKCIVDGCDYGGSTKGYCKTHYQSAFTSNNIEAKNKCSIDGCNNNHGSRGYCKRHYNIALRAGEFPDVRKCSISTCNLPHQAKGYCEKHYGVLKLYKLSPEVYEDMLLAQDNQCAICKKPPANLGKGTSVLYVDHDHIIGNVRGLLCHYCNSLLGHANDDINILQESINYLRISNV